MQPTRSWFGVCRTVELLHVKKTLKRHLIQHTAAYVTNQKRVQHVRTWLTLPNDWPQPMKVYRLALQLCWFPNTKWTWHDTREKNGLPICKIIQRHLPCLHPVLFRLLGNSVLLGLDGFVRFWSECLGEMFVVPCYLSTFHIIITCKANEATNIHWLTFSVGASTSKLSWASLASAAITCNFTAQLRREK